MKDTARQLRRLTFIVMLLASARDSAAAEKTSEHSIPGAPVRLPTRTVDAARDAYLSEANPAPATALLFMMTRTKPGNCDVSAPPPPTSSFAATDGQAFLWFYVTNVAAGDVFASEYYTPAGAFYASPSGPWAAAAAGGNKCYADSPFQIAGALPATLPGLWTVRVKLNGAPLFTHTFTIAGGSACTFSLSAAAQTLASTGGSISVAVATTASCNWTASSNASFITVQSGASGTGSGAVSLLVAANPTGAARTGAVTIAGQTYTVTQSAQAVAAAQMLLSMMTRAKPPTCDFNAPPTPATALSTTDSQVFLWFYMSNVAAGDVFASEYYSPAGAFYAPTSGSWDPSPTPGNKCFVDDAFQVAGALPATLPGVWTVRVKQNGNLLFTLPFTITGVTCAYSLSATSQSIAAAGGSLSVGVTTVTACSWSASTAATWITVPPGSTGSGNLSLTIAANTAASSRTATVTIADQTFTVTQSGQTVQVLSYMMARVRPSTCDANAPPAVTSPFTTADQQAFLWLYVTNVAAGDVFASEYYTPSGALYTGAGGTWDPSPSPGNKCLTDSPFQISGAVPAALPGAWTARVKLNGNPLVSLTFTIGAVIGATPAITSFGGGASFSTAAEDGSWATIIGTNLSTTSRTWRSDDIIGGNLPVSLDGVSVTVDGKPAYLYFISPNQVNFQVPDTGVTGPVRVVLRNAGGTSNSFTALLGKYAPGLFIFPLKDGRAYPAAVAADGTYLGPPGLFNNNAPPARGARPGESILLFGTGFGPTVDPSPAGKVFSRATPTADPVTAIIGGNIVAATYAGLTGVGLYQINLTVPPGLADGIYSLTLSVAGAQTQPGIYLNVAR